MASVTGRTERPVDTTGSSSSTGSSGSTGPPSSTGPTAFTPSEWVCAGYFTVQAVGGIVLWVATRSVRLVRSGMELLPDQPQVTDAFLLPDVIAIIGSALAVLGILRRSRWRVPMAAFTFGCVVYPTVLLAWWVPQQGTGAGALAVMLPTALLCGWCALQVWRDETTS